MEAIDFVKPLREADAFHKNVSLMFDDIVASIMEKTLPSPMTVRTSTDRSCGVWSSTNSDHKGLFVFESAGKFRFIQFFVKVSDDLLRGKGSEIRGFALSWK